MPNCNNHENMVATENKILCELPLVSYFRDYGGLCGRGLGADVYLLSITKNCELKMTT